MEMFFFLAWKIIDGDVKYRIWRKRRSKGSGAHLVQWAESLAKVISWFQLPAALGVHILGAGGGVTHFLFKAVALGKCRSSSRNFLISFPQG